MDGAVGCIAPFGRLVVEEALPCVKLGSHRRKILKVHLRKTLAAEKRLVDAAEHCLAVWETAGGVVELDEGVHARRHGRRFGLLYNEEARESVVNGRGAKYRGKN